MWLEWMDWLDLNGDLVLIGAGIVCVVIHIVRKLWITEKSMAEGMKKANRSARQLTKFKEHEEE